MITRVAFTLLLLIAATAAQSGGLSTDLPLVEKRMIVLRCGGLYGQSEVKFNPVSYETTYAQCLLDRWCPPKYGLSRAVGDLDHGIQFRIDKDLRWKMRIDWRAQQSNSAYFITHERDGKAEIVDAGLCREDKELSQLPAPAPVRQSADTTNAWRAEIKVVAPETDAHPAVITVTGHFGKGDNLIFFYAVEKIHSATVYFDSPGGNSFAGVGIGEIIHERGFHTAVLNYGKCLSACANAWLGGTKRYVGDSAVLAFHHPTFPKDIVLDEATAIRSMERTLGIINSYVVSMLGFSKDTAEYVTVMVATNPNSLNFLTAEDGEKYGIAFTRMNITAYNPLP
jgi:hypothetical protein